MLMVSPVERNHMCAEEAIKIFTLANEEYYKGNLFLYRFILILDFLNIKIN